MIRIFSPTSLCLSLLVSVTAWNDADTGDIIQKNDVSRRKRSDDVNALALKIVVQQQAVAIQEIRNELTSTKNELTATRNELAATKNELTAAKHDLMSTKNEVTRLKQSLPGTFSPVAFTVTFSHNSSGHHLSNHSVLKFDQVLTNLGDGYSPHSGIFTTPYAGLYSFFLSFMAINDHKGTRLAIDRNGTVLDAVYSFGTGFNQGSSTVSVHLAAGDQVWVRQDIGNAVRGSSYTIFTGYLLQAD